MKKGILIIMALVFCMGLMAKPVSLEKARQLGGKFMTVNHRASVGQCDLAYTEKTETGMEVCYVFRCQPKGFVIIAADDRMKPVLGYSTESNFFEVMPDGLRTFFDNYKAGFEQMVVNDEPQTEQALADWTSLEKTGRLVDKGNKSMVGPLLSSLWNQTDLYNNMAPEDPSSVFSGHCKAGCVANAMSQIMRYWEWPRTGMGSHVYDAFSSFGDYGIQSADFGASTYQFEFMPDYLDFASPQYEVDATALLEYHAGVSVDMGYGASASGAYSEDVPGALINHFRYSDDMYLQYGDDLFIDEWEDQLRTNLDGGMPLYYTAIGPGSAHAFVMDGYDDVGYFHLNWGWAGFDNGYYTIDGFYLTFYSYPWDHNAIFNIHPDTTYYQAPMAVENLELTELEGDKVAVSFNPVYRTRAGEPLTTIDTLVIIRDGQRIAALLDVTDGLVRYEDYVGSGSTYYYTVYAANDRGMSKVSCDTIMVGSTCDLRFDLHDTGNNGWDLSSIAVLDGNGKVWRRVTSWDGGEASLVLPVPSNQNATFFWTYDNTCYSHGSLSEVSYEIYDWNDNLIMASDGYPNVGVLGEYAINCGSPEAVAESDEDLAILYPNPASTWFAVEGKVKTVMVYDALGQLIYQGNTNQVDIADWSDGVYFVRVEREEGVASMVTFIKR